MTETLRQRRNELQKELSRCKAAGEDPGAIIFQMREISALIKATKGGPDEIQAPPPPAAETVPVAGRMPQAADFYQWQENTSAAASRNPSGRLLRAGTEEFDQAVKVLAAFEDSHPVFVQNRVPWVMSWHQSASHQDLQLALVEEKGRVLAALWLSVGRIGPLRVAYSAPVRFCDFFDLALAGDAHHQRVFAALQAVLAAAAVDLFWFKNVNGCSALRHFAALQGFAPVAGSSIYTRWLKGNDSVTVRLSRKLQYSIRSKRKKLEEQYGVGAVELQQLTSAAEYDAQEALFAEIYQQRWGESIPADARARRSLALQQYLKSGDARVYVLKVNGAIAAYKIGFLFRGVFWEWKSCARIEFNGFSLNDIFLVELMTALQAEGLEAYNFMAGDYDYKRRWGDAALQTETCDLVRGNSLPGHLAAALIPLSRKLRRSLRGLRGK